MISLEPETQGFPIPLATTAAWLVIPPLAVRIPFAACIPLISSGEVSILTKIVSCIILFNLSASSDEKTTFPLTAPGEAGKPLAITLISLFSSIANDNFRNNNIEHFEGYYASVIYSYFAGCGVELIAEDVTNRGRIDLTLTIKDDIYIADEVFFTGTAAEITPVREVDGRIIGEGKAGKITKYLQKKLNKTNSYDQASALHQQTQVLQTF